jgi:2-amino-4-hydroxy-6-hydroxymethyldihydropteridine diphosphokinase
MSAHHAFISLGTNLGDRVLNFDRALDALASLGKILRRSSLYRTTPWGNPEQPWFLNAVVLLETPLTPRLLLARLQAIETELGRTRVKRWGPRSIDLDLLLYDDLEFDEPDLRVPHAHLSERAFVLVPLAEIDGRFGALRDALPASELAGVVHVERENIATMSDDQLLSASERVRELASFLAEDDAVRVRIQHGDDEIEVVRMAQRAGVLAGSSDEAMPDLPAVRVDTIKADLVGIFRFGRPAPAEGDIFDGDRELGYIEALGIRTPIHSMGAGRVVSVATADGSAVEYGQPLFLVARGR